ncbi:hypothetical protein EPUS_07724 [Endocarpon pusillum Z07020]|uniref:Uncharacterized protein n=1 Tax=Endocarpon pusillum (strain Z07020 / HMAS-L-300199) TaxID=1263415 RepID=U1HVW6_ENDPU|nr:uncharacterized protein EPUS_07724 [Endocarpon pusillum Z07020]ERF73519.1 hypothetical protein EPUS_07724 [Endocarpon pusillum Z07020]
MPAMNLTPDAFFNDLEQTAGLLAIGFESLLSEVESLARREQDLKGRLDFAYDEYRKLALGPAATVNDSTNRMDVLQKIKVDDRSFALVEDSALSPDHIAARYNLEDALEACRTLKTKPKPWKSMRPHQPVAVRNTKDGDSLERDYTSRNGTPSKLECPFAKMTNGNPPKESADPIAAEFHADGSVGSGTAYAQQNPNKCPIRYLDQHSPEEVAKYFENHKHEIPRSHAICISTYQQNDAKIRELDAKYGNLQNMIQSLGAKHQQYLPVKDGEEGAQKPASPPAAVAVEKWAEMVSGSSAEADADADAVSPSIRPGIDGTGNGEQRGRADHSDRPLREIRLGESPSRPWGISVPNAPDTAAIAIPSDKGIEPLSLDRPKGDGKSATEGAQTTARATGRCPFGHNAGEVELSNGASPKDTKAEENLLKEPSLRPQVILNGPVFVGYSPEQITALMQSGAFTRRGRSSTS